MIIGYGLDFHSYIQFKANTPVAHEAIDKIIFDWPRKPTDDAAIVRKCIDFAVDAAVRLKI